MVETNKNGVGESTRKVWEKNKTSLPPLISSGNQKHQKKQKAIRIKGTKLAVLKELYNGGKLTKPNRAIANKLWVDHKTSEYHLITLIKFGLVKKDGENSIYKVTSKGIDVVKGGGETIVMYEARSGRTTKGWQPIDEAHNMKVKVAVVERPSTNNWLENWKCNDKMRNNCFYSKKFGDIGMTYTKTSLIFQFPRLSFKNSDDATSEVLRLTNELCINLEHETEGLKLGNKIVTSQLITQHHAVPNDPYAVFLKKHNLSYQGVDIDIDASNKNTPETEFTNNDDSNIHHTKYQDFIKDLDSNNPFGYPKFLEDFVKMKNDIKMSDIIGILHKSNAHIESLSKSQKVMIDAIIGTQNQLNNLTKQTTMGVERLSLIEQEANKGYWNRYL